MNKNFTITGDHVRLRALAEEDMILKVKWYNDPAVRKTLVIDEVFGVEKTVAWFKTLSANDFRADFLVESLDGVPVGITGLLNIDRKNRTAECYCVIGERSFWGKGLGTEIHSVLFQWGFEFLSIEKIWASIRTNNPAIFRVVEKLGFKVEGTLRKDKVVDGERIDLHLIGLLKDEFTATHQNYSISV